MCEWSSCWHAAAHHFLFVLGAGLDAHQRAWHCGAGGLWALAFVLFYVFLYQYLGCVQWQQLIIGTCINIQNFSLQLTHTLRLPVCQVRSADRGQRHRSVPNRLLRQRWAVGQAGTPGTLPPHAAPAGRRGRQLVRVQMYSEVRRVCVGTLWARSVLGQSRNIRTVSQMIKCSYSCSLMQLFPLILNVQSRHVIHVEHGFCLSASI